MTPRKLRIPMFFKFLIGCLTLAALLIIGGTFVVKNETRLKNRGNYLQKQDRRFEGYLERVGRDQTSMLQLLASDSELRQHVADAGRSLAKKDEPKKDEPKKDAAKKDDTKKEDLAESDDPSVGAAKKHAKEDYDALSPKNGLQPDLFAVFTADNQLIWSPQNAYVGEKELPELAAVERARIGSVFPHRIQMLNNIPYQVSAMPIREPATDKVVGGMLVGVKLQRYLDEFAESSDDVPEQRMRPTLIDNLTILASAWPPESRAELAAALQSDKWVMQTVGEDTRQTIKMKDGDYDFFVQDVFQGYKNGEMTTIGKLFITRSRASLSDPAAKLPWLEILIGIGLSLVMAMAMAFWITRPIQQFVEQSSDLLEGETDLTQRIIVNSHDETADLAENINQVFTRLHHLATGVQSAAFHVGASSAEISAASKQMLSGLKDQTLKIESSTTAVTELSASIQQVAANAGKATNVAEASSTAVTSAVMRMEQIRASVDDAAGKMKELGESSKRIGNIVEVIRQISEQTSMLALNASIEAAHAGEQGRGFAVVADEVSSLARRVGQSAKDIEALIQTVKEQTQAAMASMDIGTREVENGSSLVTGTLTGLGELISVVKDTATAVQEQAVVSDEIARNMDAVRHIAGEVLAGSEESVIQAARLHELAFELEESIGGFNLDGTRIGTANAARREVDPRQRALPAAKRAKPAAESPE